MFTRQIMQILIFLSVFIYGVGVASANQSSEVAEPPMMIITLRQDTIESRSNSAYSEAVRRQQIRSLQDDFVMRHLPRNQQIWRMQTMPVLIARVDSHTLSLIQQDSAVASVHTSRLFTQMTSESSAQIGARVVNASGVTGVGASVAVIDTGVDGRHMALRGQIIHEACFSTTDRSYGSRSVCAAGASMQTGVRSAKPCDLSIEACTHGTHVAGIIAGREVSQDGFTTRGMAPGAKIIAIQVFSRFSANHQAQMCGDSATTDCVFAFEHDILRALDWIQTNYDSSSWGTLAAVNISLGNGSYSEACDAIDGSNGYAFKSYVDQLRLRGVATVISAGNTGSNSGIAFPACVSSAISVGSVSSTKPTYGLRDMPSSFTNSPKRIANVPNNANDRLLDFYAPGEFIRSSVVTRTGQSFAEMSGTSMAAPHVSGAWALIKSIQPSANVSKIYRWLYNTGQPIIDHRAGFDPTLIVPRINVLEAINVVRNASSPVTFNTWALEMGDVRVGATLSQRIIIGYRGVSTRIRWTLSGRFFRMQTINCEGYVDDLTPPCIFEVTYAPTNDAVNTVSNASIRFELNDIPYTVGLTGRAVLDTPDVALTQTAQHLATASSLRERTATPTAWSTPTSHPSARTVVAIATRTQRRVNEIRTNSTQRALRIAVTATHIVSQGGATYTPSRTPRATTTRTPLPITHTVVAAKTATYSVILNQTATALIDATRTQRAVIQSTAKALSAQRTSTKLASSRLPTFTSTVRARATQTATSTRFPTQTNTQRPTAVPTHTIMLTHNVPLYKQYRALVGNNLGEYAVLLNTGDFQKSRMPELVLIDKRTQQLTATLRLPGVDATAVSAVVNRPNQFVVAGQLNWDSMYIQVYDVHESSFVLVTTHVYPLRFESQVTSIYATDRRIFVGIAASNPPSKDIGGQIIAFERITNTTMSEIGVSPLNLAGIPTSIKALDDADTLIVIAGSVPNASKPSGFLQTVRWNGERYESVFSLSRAVPVTDIAIYSQMIGLNRVNIVFAAQTDSLAILNFDESNGHMASFQNSLPLFAQKLDIQQDQIAMIGFDTIRRLTVSSVYQWSIDRLILRRTITHGNPGGGIAGVTMDQGRPIMADISWLRFAR